MFSIPSAWGIFQVYRGVRIIQVIFSSHTVSYYAVEKSNKEKAAATLPTDDRQRWWVHGTNCQDRL
jgi:hypothetical protein